MEVKTEKYQQALKVHGEFEDQRTGAIAELAAQRDKLDAMITELETLGSKKKEKATERKCSKCGKSGHSARTCSGKE